jgi:hypothetical protein
MHRKGERGNVSESRKRKAFLLLAGHAGELRAEEERDLNRF